MDDGSGSGGLVAASPAKSSSTGSCAAPTPPESRRRACPCHTARPRRFSLLGLLEQRFDLLLQPLLGLSHLRITLRLVLAGVGLDLGTVDGHVPQLDQARLLA